MGVPATLLPQMLEIFHNKKLNKTQFPGRRVLPGGRRLWQCGEGWSYRVQVGDFLTGLPETGCSCPSNDFSDAGFGAPHSEVHSPKTYCSPGNCAGVQCGKISHEVKRQETGMF